MTEPTQHHSSSSIHCGRVIGLDYGDRRVGVALSDENRVFSQALVTLSRTRRGDLEVVHQLLPILTLHEVTQIVIGWPLQLNGREGIQTRKVSQFVEVLNQHTALPIVFWDERLTTVAAERALREGGVKAQDQRKKIDQVAAALILQGWLDAQTSLSCNG